MYVSKSICLVFPTGVCNVHNQALVGFFVCGGGGGRGHEKFQHSNHNTSWTVSVGHCT